MAPGTACRRPSRPMCCSRPSWCCRPMRLMWHKSPITTRASARPAGAFDHSGRCLWARPPRQDRSRLSLPDLQLRARRRDIYFLDFRAAPIRPARWPASFANAALFRGRMPGKSARSLSSTKTPRPIPKRSAAVWTLPGDHPQRSGSRMAPRSWRRCRSRGGSKAADRPLCRGLGYGGRARHSPAPPAGRAFERQEISVPRYRSLKHRALRSARRGHRRNPPEFYACPLEQSRNAQRHDVRRRQISSALVPRRSWLGRRWRRYSRPL